LHGFASGTPGGFILQAFAIPIPEVAGVGVAITEILVGLLVLTGLYTRGAAAVGMGLNFLLFLTASWHTTPYFLGPDLIFTFAWSPLVIAGAEGQPSLDVLLESRRRQRRRAAEPAGSREPAVAGGVSTRRVLLLELAALAAAIGGFSALFKGGYSAPRALGAAGTGKPSANGPSHSKASQSTSSPSPPRETQAGGNQAAPANGVKLGPGTALPPGQGANYADPVTGAPDILIRAGNGSLTAFSAVCTHAGCTVGYENGVIICPCHGGEYDPETGAVIAGPPPTGLEPKKVVEAGGDLYALPS
jgi:thiosulfate dehydrogenase [quinone] large subunit